uniref:Uncharacterized protein n=1 Tax=Amphimedon queenslandica TaxID=400682 RepID=A0A1X7UUC3_AMPQE
MMGLVAKHDPIVDDRPFYGPRNAKYTSQMIQNNIFGIMASLVRKQICLTFQMARFYSLMVDEMKHHSKQEQLLIVVCCVVSDKDPALIRQQFHTFNPAATHFRRLD